MSIILLVLQIRIISQIKNILAENNRSIENTKLLLIVTLTSVPLCSLSSRECQPAIITFKAQIHFATLPPGTQ